MFDHIKFNIGEYIKSKKPKDDDQRIIDVKASNVDYEVQGYRPLSW